MESVKLTPSMSMPAPPPGVIKSNPFSQKPNNVMPFGDMVETLLPKEEKVETPVAEPQSAFAKDFLGELRDFMNEFAETDLNVDSIEEPSSMSKAQANFYIKLYNQLILEETEMNELCDSEIERVAKGVNAFRKQRQDEIDRKKLYFSSILKDFAMQELEGKKAKTIKLPYGNLSFKKQQPKYIYGDEDELKSLVKEVNPDLIKVETVEKLDKSMLKKNGRVEDGKFYLGDTIIPSVTVQIQEDKFEIK